MTEQEVIEKIKKLLALGHSPEPGEARAALIKAHQLMAQYNVQVEEEGQKVEVLEEEMESLGTKSVSERQWRLARDLAPHYGVELLKMCYSKSHKSHIAVIGVRCNVELFKESMRFAWHAYKFNAKQFLKKLPAYGNCGNIEARKMWRKQASWDYFFGFIQGLINELSLAEHANALVIVKHPKVDEFKAALKTTSFSIKERSLGSVGMAQLGYRDGAYAYRNKNKGIQDS